MESDDCGGRGGGSGGGGWEDCCGGGGGRDEEVVCGGGGGEVLRVLSEKDVMSGLSLTSFGIIFHCKEGKCLVINKTT